MKNKSTNRIFPTSVENWYPLPQELRQDVQSKWEAFLEAAKEAGVKPPHDPCFLATLERVWAFSDFVARSCVRDPALLQDLLVSGDLKNRYQKDEYSQRLKVALQKVTNDVELGTCLRRFRLREMVRIAWRDLAGWADLSETMADLSDFADTCVQEALSMLHKWQCCEMGMPIGVSGSPQSLVVLGMGKLGGHELNFSSDIDLVFAYPEAGHTAGEAQSVSNEEYFVCLSRRLINVLGATTAEGFVFRVDMRLRPYGESGPLAMSFDAMEEYYQSQGREWERFAWIKARVVAGDSKAGARLLKILRPFVYRRYLDYGAFDSLKKMKQMIAVEVQSKGLQGNVKLGPGGIREIEFFGQVFQLIRGGVVSPLQEQRILKVLKILGRKNYLPLEVCDELSNAYVFLRKTEHRLQEFADRQTHDLPRDVTGKARLALAMGFPDWESFAAGLHRHMGKVHDHFNALFSAPEADTQTEPIEKELEGVWLGVVDEDRGKSVLTAAGIDDPDDALRLLDHLRNAPSTRALSREGRDRLDRLIPILLRVVAASERPTVALHRIVNLIEAIERRTCYIALLVENPTALPHLVKLCNASPWIAAFLARHPLLLDELLDPRTLYAPPDRTRLEEELRQRLAHVSQGDLEQQMEELRVFKQVNTLRVAAADVTDALPIMRVSDQLTDIAEVVIDEVLELVWNHLADKHGWPTCDVDGCACDKGFTVIAYGKFGGIELGYDSDLDLVFLHAGKNGKTKGGSRPIDNSLFFARLGQRVIHILNAHTPAGILYEVDMRLRPSGSSGLLVSHVEAFGDYQMNQAWTWEHQALVRARPVAGDPMVAKRFAKIRRQVLSRPREQRGLQQEVRSMRQRLHAELGSRKSGMFDLKQGPGGIVDIEFMVQYIVLLEAHKHMELVRWTDNVRQLQAIAEAGLLPRTQASLLKEAYLTYRPAAHRLSLQGKPAEVPEDKFRDLRAEVTKIWRDLIEK